MSVLGRGIIGATAGAVILLFAGLAAVRLFLQRFFAKVIIRITTDPCWGAFFATHNAASRLIPENPAGSEFRSAESGSPERIFNSRLVSPWDKIFFSSVYLCRLPLREADRVETEAVIGPACARPLRVEIPVLIGGMGYGTALSASAKQALAMAATKVGTAANTGAGAYLPEERAAAERLIVQFSPDLPPENTDFLKTANAVEIQLGSEDRFAEPASVAAKQSLRDVRLRRVLGVLPGEEAAIGSRLRDVESGLDLKALVADLRRRSGGVPVGVKIGAAQRLEEELEAIIQAGVDFISIDGAEGGIRRGLPAVLGDVGIPTLYALVRARRFLDRNDPERKVSLLAGGGLMGPGAFLKALALGADAIFIGTAALLALVHTQAAKVLPWEPPTALVYFKGRHNRRFDPFVGSESLADFLRTSIREMQSIAMVAGKKRLSEMNPADLCSIDPDLSRWLRIPWVGSPSKF